MTHAGALLGLGTTYLLPPIDTNGIRQEYVHDGNCPWAALRRSLWQWVGSRTGFIGDQAWIFFEPGKRVTE